MIFIKKRHYYISSGIGPICVDDEVREGFEIIGKFKLKNPHPIPIDDKEILFIKEKLPIWLKENYSQINANNLTQSLSVSELKRKIQYVFTVYQDGSMIEADIYCLTLYDKNIPYNVYIPKALWDDEEFVKQRGHKWGEYILVYPFLDEKWHSNIDCNDIYSPGDLW